MLSSAGQSLWVCVGRRRPLGAAAGQTWLSSTTNDPYVATTHAVPGVRRRLLHAPSAPALASPLKRIDDEPEPEPVGRARPACLSPRLSLRAAPRQRRPGAELARLWTLPSGQEALHQVRMCLATCAREAGRA